MSDSCAEEVCEKDCWAGRRTGTIGDKTQEGELVGDFHCCPIDHLCLLSIMISYLCDTNIDLLVQIVFLNASMRTV